MSPEKGTVELQCKVQFDIRLYFCRRGAENMEKMLKSDFKIRHNPKNNEDYVIKIRDELTKNHRENENIVSGIMPENKDDPLCPVKSFRKYLSHLHPDNKYMWQKAVEKINPHQPEIWYTRAHIGKNPLAKFMSEVSKTCGLSQIYTNHSIRVTECMVLTRCNFSHSEIMLVSGHKSIQFLAVYQKTKDKQKVQMGKALFQLMTQAEDEININKKEIQLPKEHLALPAPPQPVPSVMATMSESATTPVQSNAERQIVPYEPNFEDDDISDIDLLSALCGVQDGFNSHTATVTKTNNVITTAPRAMFMNYQIRTINFTITKK